MANLTSLTEVMMSKPIFDELTQDPDAWLGDALDVCERVLREGIDGQLVHISKPLNRVVEGIR